MSDHTDIETPLEGGSHGISIDDDVNLRTSGPVAVTQPRSPSEAAAAAEGEQRPDFLHSKFATVEEQARAYFHADSLIGKQGAELAQLRAELEEAQQFQSNMADEIVDEDGLAAYQAAARYQDINALRGVGQAAREAVVARAIQSVPGLADQLAAEAAAPQIVESGANEIRAFLDNAAPDWQVYYPRVVQEINANNLLPEGSDVNTIATTMVDLTNRLRAQEHMKITAQTAVGSGTRPTPVGDGEAEWSKVREAGSGSYAERMRGQ